MPSLLISIAVLLLAAYVGMALILYFMQAAFLYGPSPEISYTPADLGLDFEKVFFESADGLQLNGWFIPAENSSFTILFCHGNAGNIAHRLDSISLFNNLGLNCFIFDYRGYGLSEGKPTEQGTYLDAQAAYRWLTEDKKLSPGNIIIFGRSLGGSVAAHLAGKVDAKSLVIESAFTSYVEMGRKFYPYLPVRLFATFRYDTIDYLKDVAVPVMIIHSKNDELLPFDFALALYEAANDPKELVEIFGSHNDGFVLCGDAYTQGWSKWLRLLEKYQDPAGSHQAS
ncbi:MAG: alpha/beta hydrolase [Planctomycetota bacterium]|jgi:fermentation-respiration switch protein FrsA (DUF1100 family)